MPQVHASSLLSEEVQLADDVIVGPGCILQGPITMGAGTHLIGNVHLQGPLTMGTENLVYPFSCLGFAPQHQKFDPHTPGCGVTIGNNNVFREYVTVNRAFTDEGPTTIGNENWFMINSHIGHDSCIGNNCTFVNSSLLGGHVTVGDQVTTGGGLCVHQFCAIGRGAMTQGNTAMKQDLAPYFLLTGPNICGSINLVGMRRQGLTSEQITTVKWVFKTIYRRNLSLSHALQLLRERADDPLVAEYVQFIEQSKRGLCSGFPRTSYGTVTKI
jgi:UDP-N-acetylglucosamine acyltransferase